MILKQYKSFDAFQQDWKVFANEKPRQQKMAICCYEVVSTTRTVNVTCCGKLAIANPALFWGRTNPFAVAQEQLPYCLLILQKSSTFKLFPEKCVGYLSGNVKIFINTLWQASKQEDMPFTYSKI